jgi:hypothetical protein
MHSHYSLTPRLLLVGAGSLLALLVLVFLLGLQIGRLSAPPAPSPLRATPQAAPPAAAPAPAVPAPELQSR